MFRQGAPGYLAFYIGDVHHLDGAGEGVSFGEGEVLVSEGKDQSSRESDGHASLGGDQRGSLSVDESGTGTGLFFAPLAEQALGFCLPMLGELLFCYRVLSEHLGTLGILLDSLRPVGEVVLQFLAVLGPLAYRVQSCVQAASLQGEVLAGPNGASLSLRTAERTDV